MKRFIFILPVFFICIIGCVDFSTYSDSNEVVGVHAGILSSDDVIIDKQEIISATEGRIVLKVKGLLEESLPLTVDAEFELSPESKILYSEKYKQFIFHSVQDSFSFQVIAQSGLPKKWTISLQDVRNSDGDILSFKVKSWEANTEEKNLIVEEGRLYKLKDTSLVEVFLNTASDSIFPLKIVPKIQVSENGNLLAYQPATPLVFENLQSVYNLKVEAENRTIRDWRIYLRTPDSDDVNLKEGNFTVYSDCLDVENMEFEIDTLNANAVVSVAEVRDWKNFNVLLDYKFQLPLGAKMVLLEGETADFTMSKVIFNRIEEVKRFKVVSQSGKEKIWKIKLGYAYTTSAGIENFSISSYRPGESVNVSLDLNAIDTVHSAIYVNVNSGVKNISAMTPLYILPVLKLSDKASIDGVEADLGGVYYLPEIAFTAMNEVAHFTILSEARNEYEWKIVLVDKQKDKNGEAEIKNVVLHADKLPDDVKFTDDIYTADADHKEIVLKMNTVKFPFLLDGGAYTVNISEKAKLLVAGQSLVFENVNDRKSLHVEAENGTEKIWTLRLEYARNKGAEIKSLNVSQMFPSEVIFDKTATIDTEQAEIVIHVTDASGSFPLRADVVPAVSEGAQIVPELKSVVFAGEDAFVRVHVIAESGMDREWTIRLKNQNLKSDRAVIESFEAQSLNPEIEIGNPVLEGTILKVPVLAGKNKFPLSLDVDGTVLSEGAKKDKVVLTFENIGRSEVLNVTSQSGKVTNRYTVVLIDQVALSSQAGISVLELERYQPLTYKLPGEVVLTDGKALINVYDDIDRELIIWPVITLSEGAKLEQAIPGQGISFSSLDATYDVGVIAEDGTRKKWSLGLQLVDRPKSSEAILEQVDASASGQIAIEAGIQPNNDVVLYIGNSQPRYPFTVEVTLSVSPNAKVEVINQNTTVRQIARQTKASDEIKVLQVVQLIFNSADDHLTVKVTSEDGTANNIYQFSLGNEKSSNDEADVLDYKITSYFPMNMFEAPIVFAPDTEQGIITINAPGEEVFPFTVYTKIRLSSGATISGLDVNSMTFERGFAGKDFQVISESGKVKNWQLVMKVAEKSKENNVTGFEIKDYTPLACDLGKPEIRPVERKIVIPVKEWVKGERLTLTAGVELSPKATTDFRSNLFFQSAKDEYSFYVTAQNGDIAEWTVVLDYTYSELAEITSFLVTAGEPSDITFEPKGVIDVATHTVYVDVLENLTFPFVLTADIEFSAKSEADLSALSGDQVRFDRYQDSTIIRVTAEDGVNRKDWKVKLRYHFSEEADITNFDILSAQPAGVVLGNPAVEISQADHMIWINVADWGGLTNLQISPRLTVSEKASHSLNGDLLFVKKTSENKVINVTAESGRLVPWNVRLRYHENSDADITKVTYGDWEPSDINFIGTSIDTKTATVTLELQTWNGQVTFTLNDIACVLSDKATAVIPTEMTFRKRIQESLEYVVKAQDGTEKKWTFKLLYHESNAAEVVSFKITGNNKQDIISMSAKGDIQDGTISIDLNSGVRDAFESGFQISVETELSAKATSNIPSSMLFSKPTDTRRYTVTAESGVTKEWTVKFVNNASQESSMLAIRNAVITGGTTSVLGDFKCTDFNISGTTATMTITDIITLNKYDRNWPTLNIDLDVQLSARAKIKEGNTIHVSVSNPGTKTLTVMADDGVHQQVYTLEVLYKPQLENANLDSWSSDNKTPGGSMWSTANNSFVSGTTKTTGKSGSAALLTTSEAVGMKAAGTIFLGYFKFTSLSDALNDPEKMTYFGVAFPARPKQLKVDVQYRQGSGTLNDGSKDKGQIWVALEYWPDPSNPKNANNKRYAYGEVMLAQTVGTWTTYTININVVDASVIPTNLLIVASSSFDGNHFNAVNGSEMKVDNFELIY